MAPSKWRRKNDWLLGAATVTSWFRSFTRGARATRIQPRARALGATLSISSSISTPAKEEKEAPLSSKSGEAASVAWFCVHANSYFTHLTGRAHLPARRPPPQADQWKPARYDQASEGTRHETRRHRERLAPAPRLLQQPFRGFWKRGKRGSIYRPLYACFTESLLRVRQDRFLPAATARWSINAVSSFAQRTIEDGSIETNET